jgi:nascent polypeptide-associated complex subunit alpha
MQQMMRKMGVSQQDLDVEQVIFKMRGKTMVINSPSVSKVNMMGQETYQVAGRMEEVEEDSTPEISDDDIQTVMDQTGCSEAQAQKAIEKHKGDLAEAIMSLQK